MRLQSISLIRGSDFVEVWNLLDIVNICGDQGEGGFPGALNQN